MAAMKRFWKYFLNFIVLYLIVSGLIWLCLRIVQNRNEQQTQENTTTNSSVTEQV